MLIVHDGACPLCRFYVRRLRIERAVGSVEIVDARSDDPRVVELADAGYDLDAGMVAVVDGRIFHGDEAVHALALLSTPIDAFNRLNRRVLGRSGIARALYPLFRAARRIALALTGTGPLRPGQKDPAA
jgi:predicted DCC family thiol-disulfide oxidoreductase YuxK